MSDEPKPERPVVYCVLDLETTGLDPDTDVITDFAWMTGADGSWGEPRSFPVLHEGFPSPWSARKTEVLLQHPHLSKPLSWVAATFFVDLIGLSDHGRRDVYLVGANPTFDHAFLTRVFPRGVPYDYHLVCVEVLVMGRLGLRRPPHLSECRELLGMPPFDGVAHTALDDARNVAEIFSALGF